MVPCVGPAVIDNSVGEEVQEQGIVPETPPQSSVPPTNSSTEPTSSNATGLENHWADEIGDRRSRSPPQSPPPPQTQDTVPSRVCRDQEIGETWPLLPPSPPPAPQLPNIVAPRGCRGRGRDRERPQVPLQQRTPPRQREDDQERWVWSNTYTAVNYRPRDIPFQGNERIKVPLPQNPEEIDFFNLYFTDAVIDIIWRETNRYALQYIEANRNNLRPQSIVHDW